MHHQRIETIDDKARVWIVTRGADGRLQDQLDPALLGGIHGNGAKEIAAALSAVAGDTEAAADRLW